MKKPISFFVFCLFLSAGFLHAGTGERAEVGENTLEWKAGVEKVNITPEQSMWMAGYGSRDRPSEGTLHDSA